MQRLIQKKVTHRPPLTPLVLLGYFDDDAIISALTRLSTDPEIPVILAQAVLHVWTAYGGVKPRPHSISPCISRTRMSGPKSWRNSGTGLA